MSANISYTIIDCSGEDDENPCSELLAHTQESKGWSTPRDCSYPQHITLKFPSPARLHQVQLLSHEYKIAGKVEIQIAPPSDPSSFTRLGYLSFDPNDKTNYSARELKSVSLPHVHASALKLTIHRCHPNSLNIYNQACFIMANIVGEHIEERDDVTESMGDIPQAGGYDDRNASLTSRDRHTTNNAAQHGGVDSVTAQRIAELQIQKTAAVEVEDYDEAKRLKLVIERLLAAGEKMAALEARKKAAVEAEDYDMAKSLKIELEKMRQRAYAVTSQPSPLGRRQPTAVHSTHYQDDGGGPDTAVAHHSVDDNHRVGIGGGSGGGDGSFESSPPNNGHATDIMDTMTDRNWSSRLQPKITANDGLLYPSQIQKSIPLTTAKTPPVPLESPPMDWKAYEERPARAKGSYNLGSSLDELGADSLPPGVVTAGGGVHSNDPLSKKNDNILRSIDGNAHAHVRNGTNGDGTMNNTSAVGVGSCPPAPPEFPSELPVPEPLSPDAVKESRPLENLVGEFYTRCLYSKSWQLREAAMTSLANIVLSSPQSELTGLNENGDSLRIICSLVSQGLKARIPAVCNASLVLLKSLVASSAPRCLPMRDLQASLAEIVPTVVERAGDVAPRSRDAAIETLVEMAKIKESGLKANANSFFLKPLKESSPKSVLGRLKLVEQLLPIVRVLHYSPSDRDQAKEGFAVEAVVQFCAPALTSASVEVRSAASAIIVRLGTYSDGKTGSHAAILSLVSGISGLNPKLKQQLEAALFSNTNGEAINAHTKSIASIPSSSSAASAQKTKRPSNGNTYNNNDNSGVNHGSNNVARKLSLPGERGTATSHIQRRSSQTVSYRDGGDDLRNDNKNLKRNIPSASQRTHTSATSFVEQTRTAQNEAGPSSYYHHEQPIQQQQPQYTSSPLPPQQPSAMPSSPGMEYSVADEDPLIFENELRRREALYGPRHPAVAEAASNLAIVYNQRGEGTRALPLYQQALTIWEGVHGPKHTEVAHALTDIAVILLEAGHDKEGKQLLKRALDIQLELLGPNHPDVVAIRDVLFEE